MFYTQILNSLKQYTDKVVLFHSATGKDSICLLNLLSDFIIQPVFMYLVPDLDYENKYIEIAEKKYNVKFYKTPHYALYSFIKNGYLGIKQDKSIRQMKISQIDSFIKEKFNIDWSIYGFKKSDGVTRRLMLNGYKDGLCHSTKKVYPLMDLKNKDVLNYIKDNGLMQPFNYSKTKPSSGCDVSQPEFLAYIKKHYPNDLKKIFNQFPHCEVILFKHENYKTE